MIFIDEATKLSWQKLEYAVLRAREKYNALSPEEKAEHDRKQRESFVRGMMPTGDQRFD
ncbi:hypothetical protein HJB79_31680 [Rhizobium lentis]|uniref:hypothetical protein n=1 Tax=Rhizobium lentis TaxID=1138194 RepID=UPI001C839884|nr:hypothetical protein [Rhizobium lentis]MBX5143270.1 hypothetical protein [Rhizobium lentis]